jgi:hypothetical protein
MPGDATDPELLARAVEGADAVILTLGVPRDIRALQPTTLFSTVTQALIPAMEDRGRAAASDRDGLRRGRQPREAFDAREGSP